MVGAVFNVFYGRRSLSHACKCKTKLAQFETKDFCGLFQIFAKKNVYEPNFGTFWVISTLIFYSLCLMIFISGFKFFCWGLPQTNI